MIDFEVPPGAAAVAIAVLCGADSVRAVGRACGWASPSTAHVHVKAAHALGLVLWDPDLDGTLRPALGVVASSFGR